MRNQRLTPSQQLYHNVRKDIFASMETGNFDRARLVLEEYRDTVQNDPALDDYTEDLRTEIVEAYAVSL
mgnify:CR=1 FL=1